MWVTKQVNYTDSKTTGFGGLLHATCTCNCCFECVLFCTCCSRRVNVLKDFIFRSGTDLISLLILLGRPVETKAKASSFQITGVKFGRNVLHVNAHRFTVGFSIWHLKMVAMTSFHREKCCHLLSENEVYASSWSYLFVLKKTTIVNSKLLELRISCM